MADNQSKLDKLAQLGGSMTSKKVGRPPKVASKVPTVKVQLTLPQELADEIKTLTSNAVSLTAFGSMAIAEKVNRLRNNAD